MFKNKLLCLLLLNVLCAPNVFANDGIYNSYDNTINMSRSLGFDKRNNTKSNFTDFTITRQDVNSLKNKTLLTILSFFETFFAIDAVKNGFYSLVLKNEITIKEQKILFNSFIVSGIICAIVSLIKYRIINKNDKLNYNLIYDPS